MKYVVGNWKSNKRLGEALEWFKGFGKIYKPISGVKIVVAVPYPFLIPVRDLRDELELDVELAVQDVSPFPFGAYTGAVTAEMVAEWADWAIVGHSERREYFHETDQEVANKVVQLKEAGVGVVLCVDEPYAQSQRAAIGELPEKLVVAYEPIEAIGTGNPEDPEAVKKTVAKIKEIFDEAPVIYGGSVNPENAGNYLRLEKVSGALPGGASLEADKFGRICETAV